MALKTIERKWHLLKEHTQIPKDLFLELITFCIKETRYFKYEDKYYEQNRGMPMGSPASPIIADIIMEELLNISIGKMRRKPRLFTKYVDDLFGIVKRDDIEETLKTLNEFNRQIQFTFEKETDNKLAYLDSVIVRHGDILKLDWYHKPMASGRLINFYSKHPRRTIINTANNFINRVLEISDEVFHSINICKIRNILSKNDFPNKTINELIKKVKTTMTKGTTKEVQPPIIYKTMTYVKDFSERIKHSNIYNREKYELAFKTENTTKKLFSNMKSRIEKEEKSHLVYRIHCNGDKTDACGKVYVGTTKNKLKTRLAAHRSDEKATNKPLEQKTALAAHCTITGHKPNFNDVDILVGENNYKKRFTLEMLHIVDQEREKTLNFKRDTENCAKIYKHAIDKHKSKIYK